MSNLSYYSYRPPKNDRVARNKKEPKRRYLIAILLLVAAGLIGYGWHRITTDNKAGIGGSTIMIAGFSFKVKSTAEAKPKIEISSKLVTSWGAAVAGRSGLVDVALYDHTTGETAHYSTTGSTFNAASTEKIAILEATLLSDQEKGHGLTSSQLSLATPMIENSDNDAASALWDQAGGAAGLTSFYKRVGTTRTTVASGGQWGLTQTTADDQLKIINQIAYSSTLLNPTSQKSAYTLLDNIEPDQAWGVTGGVPDGVSVQLKNGWLPDSETGDQFDSQNTWTVNSIGHIHGDGKDYTIAVLTMGSPTESYGIDTISAISSATWKTLTPQ